MPVAEVEGTQKLRGAAWVTREHVFVDRVACPWLIRRFIDPEARFEFVPWDADVGRLEREGKISFDMETGAPSCTPDHSSSSHSRS